MSAEYSIPLPVSKYLTDSGSQEFSVIEAELMDLVGTRRDFRDTLPVEVLGRIDELSSIVVGRIAEPYMGEEATYVGPGAWIFNTTQQGCGIKWGNNAVQVVLREKPYKSRDIERLRRAAQSPDFAFSGGVRMVFMEGNFLRSLALATELVFALSDGDFLTIAGESRQITAEVVNPRTFRTTTTEPQSYRFAQPGNLPDSVA